VVESRKPPVFIVGAPRSGTTLLRRILNRHPALAVCEEIRFFEEIYARRSAFGALDTLDGRERFVRQLLLTARVRQQGSDLEKLRGQLMEQGTGYREVFRCILQFYADSQGKSRCGDKSPMNAFVTETLCEWYPGAPIIHLVRDPRDVVASLQRMSWAPKSIVNNAFFWVRFNQGAERSQHRPEYLRVHYERLVEDPERELIRICSHIGEDYCDSLLTAESFAPYSWPRSASGAVTRERLGTWREQLTPQQVSVVEWITEARLAAYGYSPSAGSLSVLAAVRAIIQAGVDLARRRLHEFPHQWLCWTQPANLAAQEYRYYRDRWDLVFPGLQPLHVRRDD
jgi:Sulfotransferase family